MSGQNKIYTILLILCCCGMLFSCYNTDADGKKDQKEKTVMKATEKIDPLIIPFHPDLQNEETFRSVAVRIKPSLLFGTSDRHSQAETELLLAADSRNLYIHATCMEPLTVDPGNSRLTPWKSDNIEIFLANLDRPVWYRQFVIGTNGCRFSDMVHEDDWSGSVSVETKKWSAKVTIPLKQLGSLAGDKLCMNILRQRKNAKEFVSWSKVDYRALEPYNFRSVRVAASPDMIRQGPWTFNVKTESAGIAWETVNSSRSSLFYRKKGTAAFVEVKENAEQLLSDLHSIVLCGLEPDTEYEYCIAGGDRTGSFRTLSEKSGDFSFALTMDVHGRRQALQGILNRADVKKCDLFFLLGDQLNASIARDVHYDGYLNTLITHWQKPFYCIYGNHDARGEGAGAHFELFANKKEIGYDAFLHKGVFFVILDSDRDTPAGAEYMEKQTEFLRNTVRSEAFRKADFRVLLLHVPLTFKYRRWGDENIRMFASLTKAGQEMFDLALSAHTHDYCVTLPGKKTVSSTDEKLHEKEPVRLSAFPEISSPELGLVIVHKKKNSLQVSVMDRNAQVIGNHLFPFKDKNANHGK